MIKLNPVLKDNLWGGERLKTLFGRKSEGIIAESWEASVHKDGVSKTDGDSCDFLQFLSKNKNAVNKSGGEFPVLIKYIDAAKKLSVQVHPSDEFAKKYENDNGKTEVWYVIEATEGAGIYCGFKRDVEKDEFLASLANGTVEELLNFIPVKSGDCFLIEAGTVHAIGAGCLICEVQQSSNVTYRVYDYMRRDKNGNLRELHVDKAVQVINFSAFKDNTGSSKFAALPNSNGKIRLLTACKYFKCREVVLSGEYSELNENSFTVINVISGGGKIGERAFIVGDTFFVPCGEAFSLSGEAKVIITTENC